MNELHDYLKSQNISDDQAKEILRIYHELRQRDWATKCNICFRDLTLAEIRTHRPMDFHHTCFEHREYGPCLDVFPIREELGLPQLDSNYLLKDFV